MFQFLIYFALKKKDRIVNPILDTLNSNLKKSLPPTKKQEKIEKKNSFDMVRLDESLMIKRKTSLNSIIFGKFDETSFKYRICYILFE